jgi:hypothetical protein
MKNVIVHSVKILQDVPSASGMARYEDTLYIVSDDSPYLHFGDTAKLPLSKLLIHQKHKGHYKIPKVLKTDYESCFIAEYQGKAHFFAFGSGSRSPQRDVLLIVSLPDHAALWEIPITSFYELLRKYTKIDIEDFNIEGAAYLAPYCYLFNRMNNEIVRFHWEVFLEQLLTGNEWELVKLELETSKVHLPVHLERLPGFSGASGYVHTHEILFSASVECTDNSYDDGEILASYVGVLDIRHFPNVNLVHFAPITDQEGALIKEKVEGIEWLDIDKDGEYNAHAVVDNDNESSKFLHLKLKF